MKEKKNNKKKSLRTGNKIFKKGIIIKNENKSPNRYI